MNTGKTNLLTRVTRPMGGEITVDYERAGNTQDMPQSRWVMKKVTVTDGMTTPGVHSYATEYAYTDGYYDRGEREFYGFAKVTETRGDGSSTMREYDVTNYYTKGFERKSVTRGSNGKIYTVSGNINYPSVPIVPGKSMYTPLREKKTKFYEGASDESASGKETREEYAYDQYGNVTYYKNYADTGSDDDVSAEIGYEYRNDTDNYMVAIPKIIIVRNSNGEILRERRGLFDAKGNLRELTQGNGAHSAVTSLAYDGDGNLIYVSGPPNTNGQRYSVSYTYDSAVKTYVEGTRDSFGYTSYARYDYRYGAPTVTTDTNRNSTLYTYDGAGRLDTVTGPYDIGRGATIRVRYYAAQVSNGLIASPASSRVENKGYYASEETIDTQTFADGLGRIIQTKKSASINGESMMSVSGAVEFDIMGRVIKQGMPAAGNMSPAYTPTAMSALNTLTEYDPAGRQKKITSPDGSSVNIAYGFEENMFMTRVIDRMGKEKRTLKDVGGSIIAVKEVLDGDDITTRYKYNALNEITRVTDHKGNITRIAYDVMGRRTEIDNSDAGRVQYIYDTAGNMTRKITPNLRKVQKAINYKYEFNRLMRIDYPESADVTYEYGAPGGAYNTAGRIKKVTQGSPSGAEGYFSEEFGYGRLGETVKSTRTIKDTAGKLTTAATLFEFDSMGRMRGLTYPDGERLVYTYDSGGLLASAYGTSQGTTYTYIKKILYDEYGQRIQAEFGNNTKTTYQYDPETRYLTNLKTTGPALSGVGGPAPSGAEGKIYQNLSYEYDREGNILKRQNNDFFTDDAEAKRSTQTYEYDDLHRLVGSTGSYNKETWLPYYKERVNSYTNNIQYSPIGNILRKDQVNKATYPDTGMQNITATTYDNSYEYTSHKPHAVTKAGTKLFSYDDNGNMTRTTDSSKNFSRDLSWNEENRLMKTVDTNGTTTYKYDPSGNRTIKSGKYGEVVYVNPNYTVRNGDVISKHVFAGNSRVASKLEMKDKQGKVDETGIYYTHGDHLGSSSVITAKDGSFHESIEYFPYGETWVHDKVSEAAVSTPYKYTGKEQDPETGLFYYGARYYDPVLSRWISTDPPMMTGEYFPVPPVDDDAINNNEKLPGIGGVFNSINIDVFHYAGNNPVKFIDPDGNAIYWINRELGGTEVRGIWNPFSHSFLATADKNGNVEHISGWGEKWLSSALPPTDAKESNDVHKEMKVAQQSLKNGDAMLLTNDDKLDAYMLKATKLLSQEGSPSDHKWNPGQTCKDEAQRLLGTAIQIYKKETGKDYDGLTPAGKSNMTKLSEKKFEQLYKKAFGK